jgi:hypothetical protein
MIHILGRRLVSAILVGFAAYFVLGSALAASKRPQTAAALDQLIPRDRWEEAGLNRLTVGEQQALAHDIVSLLPGARTTEENTPPAKDRSQWRQLQRHMTKDDVRKLLGEPRTVSVSRYAESWYFVGGSVTFDGKGRLDMWSED